MADETSVPAFPGALSCPRESFNAYWRARHPALSDQPGEVVLLSRQSSGSTRTIKELIMGLPRLAYRASNDTLTLVLEQRALSEQEVALTTELGADAAWLRSVRKLAFPADRVWRIELNFTTLSERHTLVYKTLPRREITLAWEGAAEYSYNGGDTDKRLIAAHYDARKAVVLYSLPMVPLNPHLHDLLLKPSAFTDNLVRYGLFSPSTADVAAHASLWDVDAPSFDESLLTLSTMPQVFPETLLKRPPLDVSWLPSLLVPPATSAYGHPHYDDSGLCMFHYVPAQAKVTQVAAQAPSISPLISIVGSGFERQPLEIVASGDVRVAFIGAAAGKLEQADGRHHYVPPAPPQPAVAYEPNCKTTLAPAIVATLAARSSVDRIEVSAGGQRDVSTFVTLYARQTHYLKCSVVMNALTFELWYYDVDLGRDAKVPHTETEWSVLGGNGSVTSRGAFSPDPSSPTPFTVIAGRDLGNTRVLYWAVTAVAVPLYTPTKFVTFFDE